MSHLNPFRRRLLTGLVAAPLALSLVACGSDSDDDDLDDGAPVTAPSSAAVPPASSSSSAASTGASTDAAAPAAGDDSALLAAATTALGAAGTSTLFSIDRNDAGGWEISVVDADGNEADIDVSADGATVTRGPVPDQDGDDGDDRAERDRLLGASVDYAAAIEAARGAVPGGTITGADLDEDNGVATWDVQLDEDTATEQTVVVDASTGAVLRTEQDD